MGCIYVVGVFMDEFFKITKDEYIYYIYFGISILLSFFYKFFIKVSMVALFFIMIIWLVKFNNFIQYKLKELDHEKQK